MLSFDQNAAREADQINTGITEPGKYVVTITRAEKLLSDKGTQGLGLSVKADNGQTADYLDLYTINNAGESLPSYKTVQAIMGCLQLREAKEGKIKAVKYNKDSKQREEVVVDGYPDMVGKKIGLLLQKELATNSKNGNDTERLIVFGVFQADTELTVSEILARKTKPETLPKMLEALMARPVRDSRKNKPAPQQNGYSQPTGGDIGDDLPW